MRSIEASGPGTQGQGVRQAPVHCDSSFLDHPGLKGSARRHKIPVQVFYSHTSLTMLSSACACLTLCQPVGKSQVYVWILFKSLWYGLYHLLSPFNLLCYCREY